MKKLGIICFAIMLFGVTSVNAQGILDKIDKVLDKADRASKTGQKASGLTSLFGKKKNAETAGTTTIVKINGTDFSTLKGVNEKLQTSKGIGSAKMKFSSSGSTITLEHEGTTEDLLKVLQTANPVIFSEKNIEGLDDGEILVNVKK